MEVRFYHDEGAREDALGKFDLMSYLCSTAIMELRGRLHLTACPVVILAIPENVEGLEPLEWAPEEGRDWSARFAGEMLTVEAKDLGVAYERYTVCMRDLRGRAAELCSRMYGGVPEVVEERPVVAGDVELGATILHLPQGAARDALLERREQRTPRPRGSA